MPASPPFSVIGLGTVVVDHQIILHGFPEPDTKCEISSDRYQVGGPVPTALCLLNRLGARTTFHGRWAEDHFGEIIEADFLANNIDFDPPPHTSNARSGFAHVWVEKDTGRRTVAASRGSHTVSSDEIDTARFTAHDALHLDGWSGPAAIEAATIMRNAGRKVFMDLGSPKPNLPDILENVDTLNCPARLIPILFETNDLSEGATKILALGPKEVTITDGENGARYFSSSDTVAHPGFPTHAVDTNGAGDVFSGALIYASMNHWPPERKLAFACAAAALKCRKLGNRDALPLLEEIDRLLSQPAQSQASPSSPSTSKT
ncbi:MAG: carbohydrate kinase family protein [Verrucomicrobiota bacterium]